MKTFGHVKFEITVRSLEVRGSENLDIKLGITNIQCMFMGQWKEETGNVGGSKNYFLKKKEERVQSVSEDTSPG